MPKFFQTEIAAYGGEKNKFQNLKFKKNDFDNSAPAEQGTILEIIPVHMKNPPVIQFIAYIDSMSDRFQSSFSQEQPFGRTDPYYVWKSNKRSVSISWAVPSSSKSIGLTNLANINWLVASLYPTYKDTATATSIAASPLFRFRHSNLISSPTNDGQGLLCVIQGIDVKHDVQEGFISIKPENLGSSFGNVDGQLIKDAGFQNSVNEGKVILIPKLIKLNCTLEIVHDHRLGWDYNTGDWRGGRGASSYAYGLALTRDTKDTPSPGGVEVFEDSPAATPSAEGTANPQTPAPNSVEDKINETKKETLLGDTSELGGGTVAVEEGP